MQVSSVSAGSRTEKQGVIRSQGYCSARVKVSTKVAQYWCILMCTQQRSPRRGNFDKSQLQCLL